MTLDGFLNTANLERELRKQGAIPLMAHIARLFQRSSEDYRVFPITSVHTIQGTGCWYSLHVLPVSESRTAIRYDLFCNKTTSASSAASGVLGHLVAGRIRELETHYRSCISEGGYVGSNLWMFAGIYHALQRLTIRIFTRSFTFMKAYFKSGTL